MSHKGHDTYKDRKEHSDLKDHKDHEARQDHTDQYVCLLPRNTFSGWALVQCCMQGELLDYRHPSLLSDLIMCTYIFE